MTSDYHRATKPQLHHATFSIMDRKREGITNQLHFKVDRIHIVLHGRWHMPLVDHPALGSHKPLRKAPPCPVVKPRMLGNQRHCPSNTMYTMDLHTSGTSLIPSRGNHCPLVAATESSPSPCSTFLRIRNIQSSDLLFGAAGEAIQIFVSRSSDLLCM